MLFKTKIEGSLDIGSGSIKGVALKGKAIEKYAIEALPQGAILSGNIEDHHAVRDSLKSIVSRLGLKNKNVVVSLPVQNFAVKFFKIPVVGPKEKRALIENELEDLIPNFEPAAYVTEHISLGVMNDMEDVVAVSVQKEKIRDMIESLTFAKVKPARIVPDFISLFNLIQYTKESVIDNTNAASIMVVDIGAEATKIFVEKDGLLKMQRIAAIGGNDFTDVIERNQNMDYLSAEKYKKNLELKDSDEDGQTDEFHEISELIDELNGQIKRSIDYYKAQEALPGIDGLIVTGGPSMLKGYQNILENSIVMEMRAFPIERYLASCKGFQDDYEDIRRMDTVVGNIISEVDPAKGMQVVELNFLTKEYKSKLELEKMFKIAAAAVIVVVAAEFGAVQYIKAETAKKVVSILEKNKAKDKAVEDKAIEESKRKGIPDLSGKIGIVEDIFAQQNTRFSEILYQIKKSTPGKVWFTGIDYKEGKIMVNGTAADNNRDGMSSEISVFTLEKNMKNSDLFSDVKAEYVKSSDELGNSVNTFQYELTVKGEEPAVVEATAVPVTENK